MGELVSPGPMSTDLPFFAPRSVSNATTVAVVTGNALRFSAAGTYKLNDAGTAVPVTVGMVIAIAPGITSIGLYEGTGVTPTAQVVEVM